MFSDGDVLDCVLNEEKSHYAFVTMRKQDANEVLRGRFALNGRILRISVAFNQKSSTLPT